LGEISSEPRAAPVGHDYWWTERDVVVAPEGGSGRPRELFGIARKGELGCPPLDGGGAGGRQGVEVRGLVE